LLLGLIAYGVQKLRPVFEETRKLNAATKAETQAAAAAPTETPADANAADANSGASDPNASGDNSAPETQPAPPPVEKPAPKRTEPVVSSQAAEYKGRIEQAIAEKGLTGRAKVQAIGSTLVLSGKLRPAEHGSLLRFLRDAPSTVRLVDHIEYEDAPAAGEGAHPVPPSGQGAIHIVTDLVGATATLRSDAGRVVSQCKTPCSFNDLNPAQYSLEVRKDGYQPMETALQVKAGVAMDQKVRLEALATGLLVTSKPPGADVFINGAKQSGQTPVTLPLGPGSYNLVLRMPGYEAYAGSVVVKDNIQTQQDVELKAKNMQHVAWAEVDSTPKGAEIFVDGSDTGDVTPARVQVPAGIHTIMVRLDGYQQARRTFQASVGGTVNLQDLALKPKQ
jgi:hypothetical protein